MRFDFDLNKEIVTPVLSLHNPSGRTIGVMGIYNSLNLVLRYNALSELSFQVIQSDVCSYYDKLRPKRLVTVDSIGVFVITSVREVNDGIRVYKEIGAESLEVELNYKSITLLEGTYKFYDAVDFKDTLMGKVMEYLPNWSIGTIDSDLWNIYRTFDLATQTVYGFLMGDVENAYECVFEFDTLNRTISAKTPEQAVKKTDIILGYDNLIKQTDIEENTDELITCLEVYGANDLSINLVNPLGTSKIYDFTYYKNIDWMTQGLIDKLTQWEAKVKLNQPTYATYLTELKTLNSQMVVLNSDLTQLESDKTSLEGVQKTQIEQGLPYDDVWQDIQDKVVEITAKKAQITAKQEEIDLKKNQLTTINSSLSFTETFSQDELKELDSFVITQVYQNENFTTTDNMTNEQIQDVAQNLYNQAQNVLVKTAQPRYTFSLDSINFLFLQEYHEFTKQLQLGSQILLELGKDYYAYPVLLELSLSFGDDKANISMGFGNNLRLSNDDFRFNELFGQSIKTSSQVSFDSEKWNQYGKDKGAINEFINSALDASKNAVINADNQEIVINANGLRGKRFDKKTGEYDPEQIWMTSKNLVFTKDNFRTVETALGEVLLPSGQKSYGIIAQAIIGKLLVSSELHIENEGGTFKVDANGVKIVNGDILITNDEGTQEPLEDLLSHKFLKVYESMDEMKQAIADGTVETFYQETMPTNASLGDLWFNTSTGKLYRHNGGVAGTLADWSPITDQDIVAAIEKARNAQETADGKITTYYLATEPRDGMNVGGKVIKLAEGDLWINLSEKNKLYRYAISSSSAYATWAMGSWDTLRLMTWNSLSMKTWDTIFNAQVGIWTPVQDGAIEDIGGRVDSVLTADGFLDTDKMHGQILAGKNNIVCLNQAANKVVKINEAGIIIANSKTGAEWDWTTAITADGIEAKILQGELVASESLTIKNKSNSFTVNENGVIITNGSFKMDTGDGRGRIVLDPSEGIRIQTKKSGQNTFTDRLYVDMNGDMVFNGNLQAVGGTFTGTVNAGNIIGGTINGANIDGGYISVQTDVEVGRNLILTKDSGILQGVFFGQSNALGMAHYRGDIVLKADGVVDIEAPNGLTVNKQPLTSRATFG